MEDMQKMEKRWDPLVDQMALANLRWSGVNKKHQTPDFN